MLRCFSYYSISGSGDTPQRSTPPFAASISGGRKTIGISHVWQLLALRGYAVSLCRIFCEQSGGFGYEVGAGLFAGGQEACADDVAVALAELLYQGAGIGGAACEAADHGHAADASADFAGAGEAATEGSGHIHGGIGINREFVGPGPHDRLAAVASLAVQGAGFFCAFFFCHKYIRS